MDGRRWWGTAAIAAACWLPQTASAQAPGFPASAPQALAGNVTDKPVDALVRRGDRVFLGGAFERIGPRTGGVVALDPAAGTRRTPFPDVEGTVFATAPDGRGGVYLGGRFSRVGGVARQNLAHVLSGGVVDPSFAPAPDEQVLTLVLGAGRLYAGGDFVKIGETIRRRIAALDPATGAVIDGFNPGADASVQDLALAGRRLFADGRFTGMAGKSRNGLAALDTATGDAEPGFDPVVNGPVDAVLVLAGRVYFGGSFTQVSGSSRTGLVAFDAETLELDRTFSPSVNGPVFALTTDGGHLFVAGGFTEIARAFNNGVASLDPVSGEASQAFRLFFDSHAYTLQLLGGRLYVGGHFAKANEQPRNRLAAVDPLTGAVDPTFDPDPDDDVYALAAVGGTVVAGGAFTSAPRTHALHVAAVSASTGLTAPGFSAATDGPVSALALDRGRLVAAGQFRAANGVPRLRLAAFDADDGALDALAVKIGTAKTFDAPAALAVSRGRIYVGGSFAKVGGEAHPALAAIDAASGRVLSAFNRPASARAGRRGLGGTVRALLPVGGRIYVGGDESLSVLQPRTPKRGRGRRRPFLRARSQPLLALRAEDGDWLPAFAPRIEGSVSALLAADGRLYVGGSFRRPAGIAVLRRDGRVRRVRRFRSGLVALAPARGRLVKGFRADVDQDVTALASDGSALYVAGEFNRIAQRRRRGLASVQLASGRPGKRFTPMPAGGNVRTLLAGGGQIVAGGDFSGFGTTPLPFLARFAAPPGP